MDGPVTELVQVGVGYMVTGVAEVQVIVIEKMNFVVDFAGIVDKETITEDMVVGMTVGRVVGMFAFHNNILSNLEIFCFYFSEESKFSKA